MRRLTFALPFLAGAVAAALVGSCSDNPTEPARSSAAPAHVPVSLATASTASGATLTTDRDDYFPGDTLKLTGAGWQPGDSVDLVLDEDPQNHPPVSWSVGVDENGGFLDSTYVVQDSDAGVTFYLTATSRATGETTMATFTDAPTPDVKVSTNSSAATVTIAWLVYNGSSCGGSATSSGNTSVGSSPPVSLAIVDASHSIKVTAPSTAASGARSFVKWSQGSGDSTNATICIAGSGSVQNWTVTYLIPTTTELTSSLNPSTLGASVTFTATVKSGSPLTAIGAKGAVTFKTGGTSCADATTVAGQPTNLDANGQATYITNALPLGTTKVWACYGGQGQDYDKSFGEVDQVVNSAAAPSLTITKVATDQNSGSNADTDPDFFYGVVSTYTLTVTNSGTAATNGTTITVSDVLPSQLTYSNTTSGSGWTCGAVSQTVTCTSTAVIAASGISTITLKVTPNAVMNDVSNTASVSGGGDATSASSDAEVVDILGVPNLTITKVATDQNSGSNADTDPDFFYGIEAPYTLTVTNSGTAATNGGTITVSDVLPSQLNYSSNTSGTGWTCGAVGQTVTCTSTAVIAVSGTSTITLKVVPNTVLNNVSNTASVSGGGDATSASSDAELVDILPAPTTSAAGVKPSSQQYSDKTQLSDTVTTASTLGTIAGTVYFYVGSAAQTCPASAPSGSADWSSAAVASGVATYPYTIGQAAGSYTVTACFYSSNTNFTNSDDTASLTVTKEDATVDFPSSNPLGALVSVAFSLQATIWETNPELNPAGQSVAAGNISNAVVDVSGFQLKDILGGGTLSPTSCNTTDNGLTGYAKRLTVTCNFPNNVPVATYAVQVSVSGNYYTGYGEDVFTVYDPALGFVTGGGRYMLNNERVNFGFTVKYNKKGTQPQGSLLVVRHHADGTTTRAKSNVLSGLAVNTDQSATFSGKANYYDETSTWLGNLAFTAYVKDVAEPGINKDLFGLYVAVTDANGVATSSTLTGVVGSAKAIVGGNIQVPHK